MPIVQETSVEEWNSEGNGEGWNDGWDEERKEVNQNEEMKEIEEETRVVTVLKNTVDRSAIEPKREGSKDIGQLLIDRYCITVFQCRI